MADKSDTTHKPAGFLDSLVFHATEVGSPDSRAYVYEAPMRLWHWVNAACISVLIVTGYFIGLPPPSLTGEASFHFMLGDIRMVHFAAGQILAAAFVYRIAWAFIGNHHSRDLFLPPVWSGKWWTELLHTVRWYMFMEKAPRNYMGHNPLAGLAMFLLFLLPLVNLIVTGSALYGEGAGTGSLWYRSFSWVFTLYGDSITVHTFHRLSMWIMLCFSIIHIYLAVREDLMSRESSISTMISGWRYFKGDDE